MLALSSFRWGLKKPVPTDKKSIAGLMSSYCPLKHSHVILAGAGHTLELSLPLSVSNVPRNEQKANKGVPLGSVVWALGCGLSLSKLTVAYSRNTSFQRRGASFRARSESK